MHEPTSGGGILPQVTVFLSHDSYLSIALEAREKQTSCSAILRYLAEKHTGGVKANGRKKGK